MATENEIAAEIEAINEIWSQPHSRDGRFGNVLKSIEVDAVRGITACVDFSWPITVIAGTNGSGKTTLLQLCSAAYVSPTGGRDYKIGNWIRGALGSETPAFHADSGVLFSFWNGDPDLDIPYQKERKRWGYPRRGNPVRNVAFFGIAMFTPRIEKKDRMQVFHSRMEVKGSSAFSMPLLSSLAGVLGVVYPEGALNTIGPLAGNWDEKVPQVRKGSATYAEPHMGAGEQKVIKLIGYLESLPPRSLVLLEEPEITLHADAQRGLAWYLLGLCKRRGHQFVIATHSTEIFESMPPEARVLLVRNGEATSVVPRAPCISAARQLSAVVRTNKDLVLVEDVVAQVFLQELLRRHNKTLLHNCSVVPVGNTDDVAKLVKQFREQGVRAIGVRDPDIGGSPVEGLFSLPGDKAPEILLLQPANLQAGERLLNGLLHAYLAASLAGAKHSSESKRAKANFDQLAIKMEISRDVLADRLTLAWMNAHEAECRVLADRISAAFT